MKKIIGLLLLVLVTAEFNEADAQVFLGGPYRTYRRPYRQRPKQEDPNLPKFTPMVNISFGYGFPNLDKTEMPLLYNYYRGSFTQNGPVTGAIDYQFNRNMSVGVLVTHGKVTAPYYDNNTASPVLTGSLNNWSFMLNIMRYMPVDSKKVVPYFRTAIGINSWEQHFADAAGNKVNIGLNPNDLAYQIGLGAKFNVLNNAGFFLEAGYGKYILHGGLSVSF